MSVYVPGVDRMQCERSVDPCASSPVCNEGGTGAVHPSGLAIAGGSDIVASWAQCGDVEECMVHKYVRARGNRQHHAPHASIGRT
jgi:hypothetical protein